MSDKDKGAKPVTQSGSTEKYPSVKELFKAGVQFGHEASRWNPRMKDFIYTAKNNIHIIDITKTEKLLKEACEFLMKAAAEGDVLFVGTKKQAAEIVKMNAVNSGAHFVSERWAGGLFTNFKKVRESFLRLRELETLFEKGVEGRTKYEISLMRKEWQKLNRLYGGVKTMDKLPSVVIVVDSKFEIGAVRESLNVKIPIIGLLDTNCDPSLVDYVIPCNDDAISSITIILQTLAATVRKGNKGEGVKHHLKDYSKFEVQIIKKEEVAELKEEQKIIKEETGRKIVSDPKFKKVPAKRNAKSKGILEVVQEEKEQKTTKKVTKTSKK